MFFIPEQKFPNPPGFCFFKLLQNDFWRWDNFSLLFLWRYRSIPGFCGWWRAIPFDTHRRQGTGCRFNFLSNILTNPQPSWSWKASTHFEEKEISLNDEDVIVVGNVQAYKLTNSEDRHQNFPNLLVQAFGSWNNSDLQVFSSMSPFLVWARTNLKKHFAGKSTLCLPCPNRVGDRRISGDKSQPTNSTAVKQLTFSPMEAQKQTIYNDY